MPRRPFGLAFAVTATGVAFNTLVTPSLPEIMVGVGAEPGRAGLLITVGTLPGIVLAPVVGLLADRYGRRRVLLPCLTLFGLAGGLAATSPSLGWLLGWRLLQGAGSAGLVNLAVVLIGDYADGARRAGMIGRNSAVLTIGLAAFPLLGGALSDLGGWRAPFLVYPLALVTAGAVARGLPRGGGAEVHIGEQLRALRPALGQPGVVRALAAGMLTFALIFGVLLTVLPVHLEQVHGVSPSIRGLVFGLAAAANGGLALSAGRLQRFSKRALLSTAAAVFGMALAIMAGAASLPTLVAGMVLFGAGEGVMIPNLQDIVAGSSERQRGALVALFVSAARSGQAIGPLATTGALALTAAPTIFAVAAGLCLVLLLPLVAGVRLQPASDAGGT